MTMSKYQSTYIYATPFIGNLEPREQEAGLEMRKDYRALTATRTLLYGFAR